jgi:hypothetical protein
VRRAAAVLFLGIGGFSTDSAGAAWLGTLGVGMAKTEALDATSVAELFFATPEVRGFRLYTTLSWSLDEEPSARPDVAILAVAKNLLFDPELGWFELDAGVTGFEFRDYEDPVAFAGFTAGAFLSRRTSAILIVSGDESGSLTAVAKVSVSILPRRKD